MDTLVGRSKELDFLDRVLHWTTEGASTLVLLTGEPGVGKSRLLAEWKARVSRRSARWLYGSCVEFSVEPLLPVRLALADLLPISSPNAVRTPVAPSAPSTMVVELVQQLVDLARRGPMILAVNDVHWADEATIAFLHHLVAVLTMADPAPRLLVVLTVRSGDDVPHAVRRLSREPIARTLELAGLSELETSELLRERFAAQPDPSFVRIVHEVTAGVPLLVELVADKLERNQLLRWSGGAVHTLASAADSAVSIEDEAWALRVDKVGPEALAMLTYAALLGDDVDLDELSGFHRDGTVTLDDLLDAVAQAKLANPMVDRLRLAHPSLRRFLIANVPPQARRRLEGEIAGQLAARRLRGVAVSALRLVDHAERSGNPDGFDWYHEQLLQAATEADRAGAWSRAADLYQAASESAPVDRSETGRAMLQLRSGQGAHRDGDYAAAFERLSRAARLASDLGMYATEGEALYWLTSAEVLAVRGVEAVDDEVVQAFLARESDGSQDQRALVLSNLAQQRFGRFDVEGGATLVAEARSLLPGCERASTEHVVAGVEGFNRLGALEMDAAAAAFHEAWELIPFHEDPWVATWVDVGEPLVAILGGRLPAALDAAQGVAKRTLDAHGWHVHALATACQSAATFGLGQLDRAEAHARAAVAGFHRTSYFYAGAIAFPHLAAALAYRGDIKGALKSLTAWDELGGELNRNHRLRILALLPSDALLKSELARASFKAPRGPANLFSLNHALTAVAVGDRTDDLQLIENAIPTLLGAAEHGVRYGIEWAESVTRVLAVAHLRTGDQQQALDWTHEALANADEAGSSTERALALIVMARVLAQAGAEAPAILGAGDEALAILEAAGAMTLAAAACRDVPLLQDRVVHEVAILFTDLVGSTSMNERVGDRLYLELLREHNTLVRARLPAYGGWDFTHTGDGVGAWFRSVEAAARFAVDTQRDFQERNARYPEQPLCVRVGISWGTALPNEKNLFGRAVNRAARTCAAAGAGQTLISEEAAERLPEGHVRLLSAGAFTLKGFSGEHHLYQVDARHHLSLAETTTNGG